MDSIKDKSVLITGGGRGVGKRLAMGFARAGARVGLLARSKAEIDLTKLEIEHSGGSAMTIKADVRDFEHLCAGVDRMRVRFGGVHILVAAAATQGPIGPLAETKPKAWAETLEVNLVGVMHACLAVLPEMIERRSGKIIAVTGGGAAFPRPNFSAYAASKAGLARFVETVAAEVREHNVQANCMSPGGAYTHMTDEILHAGRRAGQQEMEEAEKVRLTGGVDVEEQIGLALFLASDRSNHISGKFVHVSDDWRKLERSDMSEDTLTLRRVTGSQPRFRK
ncbi:MAG: SDR family NAD(P)-dependent oxidoreductase [Bryobacteraceae bacterium]